MSRIATLALSCAAILLSGCGTTYLYSGVIDAKDSAGTPRKVLVYWTKTERPLLYDTVAGEVTLKTECSLNTVHFIERRDGIVFLAGRDDRDAWTGHFPEGNVCGRIGNATLIRQLTDETLSLTILCKPQAEEFAATRPGWTREYLEASKVPYLIPIRRSASKEIPGLRDCTPAP